MLIRPLSLAFLSIAMCLGACQQSGGPQHPMADPAKLAEINTELGFQYMQRGEYQIALTKLEKALDADRNYVDAHNAMGLLRNRLGQFDDAERNFKRALSIDPGNSAALNNFGQFLCQRQRYDEGEKQFLKAVENPLYKLPAVAYSNAGTCALDAGKVSVAETHFQSALKIDPRLGPALIQMADVSLTLGRHLPARGYFQRYVEVSQPSARALWLGVRIERELGDRDAVSSYALQLEKQFPDSDETKLLRESMGQ